MKLTEKDYNFEVIQMSPSFKTWTCIIILHPLNKHSATLTRI